MEKIFETIIVGAGPCGLMAGRYLKDALILEQKEEIGKPIQCAEGLSKRFLDRFQIKPDPKWISTTIDNTQIFLPNKRVINFFAKGELYIIGRTNFEKFLASQCQAVIKLKKRVVDIEKEKGIWKIKTSGGEIFKSKKTANIGLGIAEKENLNLIFKDFIEKIVKKEFGNFELLENKSGPVPWE